jgi:hypothetical protein
MLIPSSAHSARWQADCRTFSRPTSAPHPHSLPPLRRLIGTNTGARILPWWAEVAPAGWGASHAYALIDAVRHGRCEPWVAAALIGPSAGAAALLCRTWEMSCAIRCWGQTTPDDPTAWMDELTQADRDRLVNALRVAPNDDAARCLPWLPEASAADIAHHIKRTHLNSPLAAYTAASPSFTSAMPPSCPPSCNCADS